MEYTKPYKTFEELADLSQSRGMGGSRETLLFAMETVGYYRLSGYWHIYQKQDVFYPGTTIEKVMSLYNFDRHFRLIILNAIEHIEVYFRTQLAHKISRDYGPFGYLENAGLPRLSDGEFDAFIGHCRSCYKRSREPFALHYQKKYGESKKEKLPPLWMMVNMMDFGQVVTMYKGASVLIRQEISNEFGVSARVLESWLLTLNTVRNICAHHGRLWNRVLGTKPAIPNKTDWRYSCLKNSDRMFCVLVIMQYLLGKISPDSNWRNRLENLLNEYPSINRKSMGFVGDWESCPLWNPT